MSTLNPQEIIAWFREKAAEFTATAELLEATFSGGSPTPAPKRKYTRASHGGSLSDRLVEEIRKKGGRAGALAERLGCSVEEVLSIVNDPSGPIASGSAGWLVIKNAPTEEHA